MKNIILGFTVLLGSFILSACADKKAFVAKEAMSTAALVYIYIEENENIDDTFRVTKYNVLINGNLSSESLKPGEYVKLDIKPSALTISLARTDVEIQSIKLNPEAGKTYYLRAQSESDSFGKFDFVNVDGSVGSKEIADNVSSTEYAIKGNVMDALLNNKDKETSNNTSQMSEDEINAMIEKKLKAMNTGSVKQETIREVTPSTSKTGSKLDDIRKAYDMKKQGLLTEEEFKAMKAEILTK